MQVIERPGNGHLLSLEQLVNEDFRTRLAELQVKLHEQHSAIHQLRVDGMATQHIPISAMHSFDATKLHVGYRVTLHCQTGGRESPASAARYTWNSLSTEPNFDRYDDFPISEQELLAALAELRAGCQRQEAFLAKETALAKQLDARLRQISSRTVYLDEHDKRVLQPNPRQKIVARVQQTGFHLLAHTYLHAGHMIDIESRIGVTVQHQTLLGGAGQHAKWSTTTEPKLVAAGDIRFDIGHSSGVSVVSRVWVKDNYQGLGIGTMLYRFIDQVQTAGGARLPVVHQATASGGEFLTTKIGFLPHTEMSNEHRARLARRPDAHELTISHFKR